MFTAVAERINETENKKDCIVFTGFFFSSSHQAKRMDKNGNEFGERCQFPNCMGAVDSNMHKLLHLNEMIDLLEL